jgi:hypothetical protein
MLPDFGRYRMFLASIVVIVAYLTVTKTDVDAELT